jgi:outer membrane protein OmpA-like peptidoglycan-associated protein
MNTISRCRKPPSSVVWLSALACLRVSIAAESAAKPGIHLCPGLTIVTAIHQQNGDYESIKTVESVGPKEVRLKYSAEGSNSDLLASAPAAVKKVNIHRTMSTDDLESATAYQQVYLENSDETIPGTTSIGTSSGVLRTLKSKGEAELRISNAYGGVQLTADKAKRPNYYDYLQAVKLRRASEPVRLPVLVNDAPAQLPVIHAEGDSLGDKMEFYFLDDEQNPLTLAFRIGIGGIKPLTSDQLSMCQLFKSKGATSPALIGGGRCDMPNGGDRDTLRVIKINSRCSGPPADLSGAERPPRGTASGGGAPSGNANALEKALAEHGTVDVYSIYFSFNSDAIRDESQPTLKDIADVLRRHPGWKLRVDGHTDNIGTDAYNLGLSKQRAAAVSNALVRQYGIDAARLTTDGFGASRPKDTNDSLEGRARNRRVELVKVG